MEKSSCREHDLLISSLEWSRWWYIAMVRDDKNDVRILMIAMTMVCMISVSFCDKGVFFQHSGHLCLDIASWLNGWEDWELLADIL